MELILIVVGVMFLLALGWLISISYANKKEIELLKDSAGKTSQNLQSVLLSGQTNLAQGLQSSQQVLGQLNTQIGELQGTTGQMLQGRR